MRLRRGFVVAFSLAAAAASRTAHAGDRSPVAVLWVGDVADDGRGLALVDSVNAALGKSPTARPIDAQSVLGLQLRKMPSTAVEALLKQGREQFGALKFADAQKTYEEAEQIAFDALPLAALQKNFAEIERGLLATYDQLNRPADAARAAERLSWVVAADEPVKALLDKYWQPRLFDIAYPPVMVQTEPPGAQVWRNMKLMGPSPVAMIGGDGSEDRLFVELPGHRSVRPVFGWKDRQLKLVLPPEDRLAVRLDQLRQSHLEAQPALVAALGKELGAERVLLVSFDKDAIVARAVDVQQGSAGAITKLATTELDKLATLGAPAAAPAPAVAAAAQKPAETPKKNKWGKWYTWVAAGGVVLLVGGLLIAQNVGDDKFTVSVSK